MRENDNRFCKLKEHETVISPRRVYMIQTIAINDP